MIWRLLTVAEFGNAFDWLTTVVGVGGLHLWEHNHMAAALIRALGPVWGITLVKGAAAFELVGLAGCAVWCSGRQRAGQATVCAAGLALASVLLWAAVVSNLNQIVLAAHALAR